MEILFIILLILWFSPILDFISVHFLLKRKNKKESEEKKMKKNTFLNKQKWFSHKRINKMPKKIFYSGDLGKGQTLSKLPCYMCDSAMVSPDLEHGYDFSSISVGITNDRERFVLESGNHSAVALRFEKFNDLYGKWYCCGSYYPKYCPNCGRELSEYFVNYRGSKFSNREEE